MFFIALFNKNKKNKNKDKNVAKVLTKPDEKTISGTLKPNIITGEIITPIVVKPTKQRIEEKKR